MYLQQNIFNRDNVSNMVQASDVNNTRKSQEFLGFVNEIGWGSKLNFYSHFTVG